jgi:GxxExxY protein
LRAADLQGNKECGLTAWFRGHIVGEFRADLIVGGSVVVELRAARDLESAHEAQWLNYLRASVEIGLLFNFGRKPQFKRLAYSNHR